MLKPIPDFPDYFADEVGNIYSMKNNRTTPIKRKPFMRNGYWTVTLVKNGKNIKKKVAFCVLSAFISRCPSGMEICHGVKGRLVDSLDNLRWDTRENNIRDQILQHELPVGEKCHKAKLNDVQVRIMRAANRLNIKTPTNQFDNEGHLSSRYLAKVFNVDRSIVSDIWNRKTWKHLP